MKNLTFANRWNADLIDQNYQQWQSNPESLDPEWKAFFEGFELAQSRNGSTSKAASQPHRTPAGEAQDDPIIQSRVIGAIYAYRSIGHTQANINPLFEVEANPRLSLERLGLDGVDLTRNYHTGNYLGGIFMSIDTLLARLDETYCGHIGCEYIHIQETPKRRWIQSKIEPNNNQPILSREEKLRILSKISQAEMFERFLHTRYVGQKRFSLEGGETIIAALDALIEYCPSMGVAEVVMGMAHRGRLNVLANILGKSYDFVFREFSENYIPDTIHGDGDVKYHLGYECSMATQSGQDVEIRLAANPSHLEAVNPVVQGKARARQRIRGDIERSIVLPLLIHGDASFAGQGIVAEVLNLSRLKGYRTGGTIHFVINNQIGFTTDPTDARSSRYCTDIAKMIEVPIFHVNGDDPLAMVMVTKWALEYRQQFSDDVIIDMYCYRRHGHNESDEPGFTQPVLYNKLKKHPLVSETLAQRMIDEGVISAEESKNLRKKYEDTLDDAFHRVKQEESAGKKRDKKFEGSSAVFQPPYSFEPTKTGVSKQSLEKVAKALCTVPDRIDLNPKIKRQLDTKWKAFQSGEGIDWALAEQLAFGTLMLEGTPVRLSGQDSERGTFSHRHAAIYDRKTRERYVPLLNIDSEQAMFCVHNSSLSEAAILGFDFGYSLDYPEMLAIWEAQFGDFANGAQTHIDQFLCSSESKWQRVSGLTLLLPHGYEGQGPEHSSARLERFLTACAEDNIQVCNLTTPAQFFHCLRRQMRRAFRKPLVIMAPKSLLRHKACVSTVNELAEGHFKDILDDLQPSKQTERLIFCSGKIYYELEKFRQDNDIQNATLIRIEQFYPFNQEQLQKILVQYKGFKQAIWCQEEPKNMGGWNFIYHYLLDALGGRPPLYVGRGAAASTAEGSLAMHKMEQEAIIRDAFQRKLENNGK